MSASPARVPIRGAQSFVAIMGEIWDRPSLSALEIVWRWLPGLILLVVGVELPVIAGSLGMDAHFSQLSQTDFAALQSISVFQPVAAVNSVHSAYADIVLAWWPVLRWLLLTVFLLWNIWAAFGRTIVLRRLDRTLSARRRTVLLLGILRSGLLFGAWFLWLKLIVFSARVTITAPAARNEDPSVVLFAAMMIVGSLLLYCLWAAFSWFLQLAPLLAMQRNLGFTAALIAAFKSGQARAKLIEINLVMNIVRIALIVLAMVFSASPLPFTAVATPEFLQLWWAGIILLYLAFCDYFHVVRAASYLSLYRVYNP